MANFIMMVGLPGSGKSTYASLIEDAEVFSSDKIREELGDVNDQTKNEKVFRILHKRIKECLANGKDAIYDATNINKKRRIAFLKEIEKYDCEKLCIWMATPYKDCIKQNAMRERKVPIDVIDRMYRNFNPPDYSEGFNRIKVACFDCGEDNILANLLCGKDGMLYMPHDNPHHERTIGAHCVDVQHYLYRKYKNDILSMAGLLHDIGKPYTKAFVNGKGETTKEAHYYQHHCVGAYDAAVALIDNCYYEEEIVYICNLIYYHMMPHTGWAQSEKARQRDRELIGEKMYQDVMRLYEADCACP